MLKLTADLESGKSVYNETPYSLSSAGVPIETQLYTDQTLINFATFQEQLDYFSDFMIS